MPSISASVPGMSAIPKRLPKQAVATMPEIQIAIIASFWNIDSTPCVAGPFAALKEPRDEARDHERYRDGGDGEDEDASQLLPFRNCWEIASTRVGGASSADEAV